MRVKRFYEPVLHTDVIFITESTPEKIAQWIRKNYKKECEGFDTVAGSVTLLDEVDKLGRKTREYLVIVEDKKDFYTLLHETVHLVNHIFMDHMIPVHEHNDEMFAYYQTFWFKKLWRFMNNIEVTLVRKKK